MVSSRGVVRLLQAAVSEMAARTVNVRKKAGNDWNAGKLRIMNDPMENSGDYSPCEPLLLTVPDSCSGKRLDLVLAELMPQHSRNRLQNWIRDQCVEVDSELATEPKRKVMGGQQIALVVPTDTREHAEQPEDIPLDIIFEDEALLVINKPPGLVVHPGSGNWTGTLMNALLKKRVAKVGDEPAVTKSQQILDLSPTATLIDTPGMMWPKIEHDSDGFMLAASHAIGRNAVIDEQVANFLGALLLVRYPALVAKRYGLAPETLAALDGPALVEAIARRRGCLLKGGGLDIEKASLILLQDYRDGALGRVSLETPETRKAMMAAHAEAVAAKAAAKAAGEVDSAEPDAVED